MAAPSMVGPLAPAAFGAPVKSEARLRYDSGNKHYNLAEYAEALIDFKEAYRLRPDPVFLFNIAQCHRRLNDPDQASTFYRSYLREQPAAPNRAEVERMITEQDEAVAAKREREQAAERARVVVVAPAPVVAPRVELAVVAPAPHPQKPLVKRPWLWVAVVGGVAVVATAVALGVVFGAPHDPHASLGTQELK